MLLWKGLAAILLFVTGEGLRVIPVSGSSGEVLGGLGDLLVGLAALAAALTALRTNQQTKSLAQSVGPLPENGETLHDVVQRIDKFEAYQHLRNHDIMNGINTVRLGVPTVVSMLEDLSEKLDERLPGETE